MLGPDRWELARLIASRTGEPLAEAATRAWVAGECLIKAGVSSGAILVLDEPLDHGRGVMLTSGSFSIVTLPLPDGPEPDRPPLMLGFLARYVDACV
jgi:enediyne polyketide synthase